MNGTRSIRGLSGRVVVEVDQGLTLNVSEGLAERLRRIGIIRHLSSGNKKAASSDSNKEKSDWNFNYVSSHDPVSPSGELRMNDNPFAKKSNTENASKLSSNHLSSTALDETSEKLVDHIPSRAVIDDITGDGEVSCTDHTTYQNQNQPTQDLNDSKSNDEDDIFEEKPVHYNRARRTSSFIEPSEFLKRRASKERNQRIQSERVRSRDDTHLGSSAGSSDEELAHGDRFSSTSSPVLRLKSPRHSKVKDNIFLRAESLRKMIFKRKSKSPSPLESPKHSPLAKKVENSENGFLCQNSDCENEPSEAHKVCHHSTCQDTNGHNPLLLCNDCDEALHADPPTEGHLRFDIFPGNPKTMREKMSQERVDLKSDDDYDEDEEDEVLDDDDGDGEEDADSEDVRNTRLKRKKALKGRRHLTESESPTLKARSKSIQDFRSLQSEDATDTDAYERKPESLGTFPELDRTPDKDDDDRNIQQHSTKKIDNEILESQRDILKNDDVFRGHSDSDSEVGNVVKRQMSNASSHSDSVVMGTDTVDGSGPRKLYQRPSRDMRSSRADAGGRLRKTSVPAQLLSRKHSDEANRKSFVGMEYFTLKFDLTSERDIEIVAAVKGVSLRNAISQPLERRGLSFDTVGVYLASSKTPLPLEADTFNLGGNNLHVRGKDGEQAVIQRSGSNSSLTPGKRAAEKKQVGMYIKRDQSKQQPPPSPTVPSQHRRPAVATRTKSVPALPKSEPHPLSYLHVPAIEISAEDESQRSKKNFPGLDEASVNDVNPYATLRGMEGQKTRPPKPTSKLSTLFNPFTKGQEKQEQLSSLLSDYSTKGWPVMPELLTLGTKQYSDSQFQLEEHWTGFVEDNESLSKSQKDHQEALWELLYTEVDYIKKVKVIIDLFMACLYNLQNESIFNEIKTEMVFSNIGSVYQANCSLWVDYMLPVVEQARYTKLPINASLLKEGFAKFDKILHPYTKYCLEYESCKEYIRKSREKNELFDKFLIWAESHEQCSRLKLQDLIVIPWQRLTKYHLLLKAIRKPIDTSENDKLCNDVDFMIERVQQFGVQVNRVMRQRLENERLSSIIDRIEAYDAIDAPNEECLKMISEFTKVESFLRSQLTGCSSQEYRQLIREGPIKLKDTYSRMDVYCFLFTDMLLITKSLRRGDKVKVIKPPMRLDKVVVHILRDGGSFMLLHLNEYHTASAVYTLHGDSAKTWLEAIKKAQMEYATKRSEAMSRIESSVLDLTISENEESDFTSFTAALTTGNGDRSPNSLSRQNSTGSVETFIPNDFARSSSLGGDINLEYKDNSTSRPRAATCGTDPRATSSQFLLPLLSSPDRQLDGRDQGAGTSPPGTPQVLRGQRDMECQTTISYPDPLSPAAKLETHPGDIQIHSSQSSLEKLLLAQTPDLIDDDNLRSKLNQRRVSRGEKRYHTADAIQDLQKDKDSTIHKRLSWNFGATMDINLEEKAAALRGMPFCSDSLRSIPSSSGVSSQGSLHLTPESDICEELEMESSESIPCNDLELQRSDSNKRGHDLANSSFLDNKSQAESDKLSSSKNKTISKSTPDICDLYSRVSLTTSEVQDGIGSVELPSTEGKSHKKMSQSQLLRVKKQLLLSNSTVEASEV